jgi:hypothetical protein
MNFLKTLRYIPVKLRNPETLSYRDRVIANGGVISESSLDAVEKFVLDCKNGNIWSKFLDVGVFAGSNLSAALVKLVYQGGASVLTNVNFVSGDYAETGSNGGLLGDGATKYLNTGFNAQTLLPDNGHFGFYLREDVVAAGNRSMIGAVNGTDQYWIGALTAASAADARYGGILTASLSGAFGRGFYLSSRNAANDLKLYKNGQLGGSNASAVTHNKPNTNVYAWAFNSAGTASAFLPVRGSFYSIGQALSATEVAALNDAVKILQRNLNREVN